MFRKLLISFLSLSLIFSTASSFADFFEEVILFPGETKTISNLPIYDGDYESISIYTWRMTRACRGMWSKPRLAWPTARGMTVTFR